MVVAVLLVLAGCKDDTEPLCVTACRALKPRLDKLRGGPGFENLLKVDCDDPIWVERSTDCYTCAHYVDSFYPLDVLSKDLPQCTWWQLEGFDGGPFDVDRIP